ncbi:MAG TPA: hypothetical protein VKU85_11410, partial [bacterium]|nr:hypothetical protein [bacterium]
DLTWEESFAEMHRIVAMLRDGHTRIQTHRNEDQGLGWVQVQYQLFPDGLRVIAVHPDHAEVLGGRVTAVGNLPADEALARMEPLISADNDWTVRDRLPQYLVQPELLAGTGILDAVGECPLEVEKDGRRISTRLPLAATHDEASWPGITSALGDSAPLYLRNPAKSYFFEPLPEHDAVYVNFRRVRDDEEETFEDFCTRAFVYLDEHDVGRLVVDLRLNGGGNNYLNRPLIHGIIRNERVNREGNLFVIVGRRTFSAAMCGTIDLERQTEALFVGEPTGATPNHHGDAVPVTLPHTGVTVSISALYWQNSDPRDSRPWLEPDIPVTLSWDDFVNGRDTVLEACLRFQPFDGERQPVWRLVTGWIEEGESVEEALEKYRALHASDERPNYDFSHYQLNAVGYELLGQERMDEAIAVFRANAEMYPYEFNPWDSLGEALAMAGRTAEAVEAYRRSVELNPASRTGQDALRRLTRGTP